MGMGAHELYCTSSSHILSCANDVRDREYQPLNSVMAALTVPKHYGKRMSMMVSAQQSAPFIISAAVFGPRRPM